MLIPSVRDGDLHTATEKLEAIDDATELQKGRGERPYDRAATLKTKALLHSMIGGIGNA